MRIIVSKYGGRFVTREFAGKGSATGEQGETEGLIRHLVKEHDVVYFGRYEGEPLCRVVEPAIKGFNENTTAEEQADGFAQDVTALEGFAPQALIMSAGYSVTMSMIDNPHHTIVQAASVRYCAPILNLLEYFELPRIVVNNDPRTYPKDQEMSLGWNYARPVALLDQTSGDKMTIVGGKRYCRRSKYARAESWAYHVPRENTRDYSAVCIAHAHVKDGCKSPGRLQAWHNVLHGSDVAVFGKGWEGMPYNWQGVLDPLEVMDVLNTCEFCPCVALENFYTGKVYVTTAQGCVPLLYTGGPYTWDPHGLFLPLDSPLRIRKPGDLDHLRATLDYAEQIEFWRNAVRPNWTALDDCLADLETSDWRSNAWWSRWGGYWPVGR